MKSPISSLAAPVVDWHSHILPGMDDGASSPEESIALLQEEAVQGVGTVFLTPHFYPDDNDPSVFLERRNRAIKHLAEALEGISSPFPCPDLLLGAEIAFYPGISHMEMLDSLLLGSTRTLLLEMPMTGWRENELQEVEALAHMRGITVLLAHFERYLPFNSREVWERLTRAGVLYQSNASFFIGRFRGHRGRRFYQEGRISAIGSDCHNMSYRPPCLEEAMCSLVGEVYRSKAEFFRLDYLARRSPPADELTSLLCRAVNLCRGNPEKSENVF